MNTRNIFIGFAVFAVVLVAGYSAYGSRDANRSAGLPDTGAPALALKVLPSQDRVKLQSLVKVYSEPNSRSEVVNVLPPAAQLRLVGMNESGDYVAIAAGTGDEVTGWVLRQDLALRAVTGMTSELTKVYGQSTTTSEVVNVFAPGQEVKLLGVSADGQFYAVSTTSISGHIDGYILRNSVAAEGILTTTNSLVKVYRTDSGGSDEIVTVLPPGHTISIIGMNPEGTWAAAVGIGDETWKGWISPEDFEMSGSMSSLPVIPIK